MVDYLKRFLVVMVMMIFISMLFIGGKFTFAQEKNPESLQWQWPVEGEISDHFGTRGGNHFGIDIAAEKGTPIKAAEDGTVHKSYLSGSYGHVVFITHSSGFETIYAHMHKRLVKDGDVIQKGQVIGYVGNTGRSHGNHLHFEVHDGGWNASKSNAINPLAFITPDGQLSQPVSGQAVKDENEDQKTVKANDRAGAVDVEQSKVLSQNQRKEDSVVTVKSGDTLWSLASRNGISVGQLKALNKLSSDRITAGQMLWIKNVKKKTYAVQAGDTLFSIAREHHLSLEELKEANELKTAVIYPSQILVLKTE
ncbi:M23 family metallopeptidase [Pseudalkalibacillus caeni]|uniref:LysM peptidoglycan-binding domain-containing protein n=1 Tax=Exobacillus caeni TaxID=2574798 RepID=A0A5R9EZJ3_9BACL|nr:M23 family metallopeptidase [Pseudalkalibacillus caeni]TLS35626.1 LysM peptidoglycan-binding domain-containing protein [Pseudalkalibacillus caeni]